MKYDTGNAGDRLLVGVVGRARGLKGHVRVRPYTDDPGRFFALKRAFLKDGNGYREVTIAECDVVGEDVVLRFAQAPDRTAAEALNGMEIYVAREDAVDLPPDAHFIVDLIGCAVVDEQGNAYGTLAEILQHGSADVYVVRGGPKGEMLFPALKAVICAVDVTGKRIVVNADRLGEVAVFAD